MTCSSPLLISALGPWSSKRSGVTLRHRLENYSCNFAWCVMWSLLESVIWTLRSSFALTCGASSSAYLPGEAGAVETVLWLRPRLL